MRLLKWLKSLFTSSSPPQPKDSILRFAEDPLSPQGEDDDSSPRFECVGFEDLGPGEAAILTVEYNRAWERWYEDAYGTPLTEDRVREFVHTALAAYLDRHEAGVP